MIKELIYDQYYGAWLPGTGASIYASSDPASANMDYRSYAFDTYGSGRTYYLVSNKNPDSYLFYCITRVIDTPGNRKDSAFAHIFRLPADSGDMYDAMRPDCFVTGTMDILNKRELDKLRIETDDGLPVLPSADRHTVAAILYQMIFGKIDGGRNRIFIQCGTPEQFRKHMRSIVLFICGLMPKTHVRDFVVGMSETVCPDGLISVFPEGVAYQETAGLVLKMSFDDGEGGTLCLASEKSQETLTLKQSICSYFADLYETAEDKVEYYSQIEKFVKEYKSYKMQACLTFMSSENILFSNPPEAASLILRQLKTKKEWCYPKSDLQTLVSAICVSPQSGESLSKVFDSLTEIRTVVRYEDSAPLLALCLDCLTESQRSEEAAEQYKRISAKDAQFARLVTNYLVKLNVAKSEPETEQPDLDENHAQESREQDDDKKKQASGISSQIYSEENEDESDCQEEENALAEEQEDHYEKDDDISSFFARSDRNDTNDVEALSPSEPISEEDVSEEASSDKEDTDSGYKSDISDMLGDSLCDDDEDFSGILKPLNSQPKEACEVAGFSFEESQEREIEEIGSTSGESDSITDQADEDIADQSNADVAFLYDEEPLFHDNSGQEQSNQDFDNLDFLSDSYHSSPEKNAEQDENDGFQPLNYLRNHSTYIASDAPLNPSVSDGKTSPVRVEAQELYENKTKSSKRDNGKKGKKSSKSDKSSKSVKSYKSYKSGQDRKSKKIDEPPTVTSDERGGKSQKSEGRNPVLAVADSILAIISKHKNIFEFLISLIIVVFVFAIGKVFGGTDFNYRATLIATGIFAVASVLFEKIGNPGLKLRVIVLNNKTFSSLSVLFLYVLILSVFRIH